MVDLALQFLKQYFGVLEVYRVKTLREPAVNRGEQVVGVLALALGLPQASEAGSGPEFPGFGLLVTSDSETLMEAVFSFGGAIRGLRQQAFSLEAMYFGKMMMLSGLFDQRKCLIHER